jgi:hypothetical protein
MEAIKIVVFVLGLFFGVQSNTVIAEKTTVTVNPSENTIVIHQENILAIYPKGTDSISVVEEFKNIYAKKDTWNPLFDTYAEKSIVYSSPKKGVLNAKITLKYNELKDLKAFAIDINPEGKFSIINIPKWYLTTEDGKLNDNYWNFEANKKFSFTLAPIKDVPETYTVNRGILFSVWQEIAKK